jgi:LacI family transcriptional regulator
MTKTGSERVTITQVAQEAGVSTQTVSRVINDRPDVSPTTRHRVQQVISRLGYQPNAIARSLSRRRSNTLGVVASGLKYYGPLSTLVGIELGANELGYSLLLSLLHQPETDDVEQIITGLLAQQVEGVIWAVPEIGNNRSWLQDHVPHLAVPIVFLSMQPRTHLPVVAIDNRTGGRIATEHLLAQGYRKIGLIAGPLDWWEARERQRGWYDALAAAGVAVNNSQIVEGDWSANDGEQGLYRLLERCPDLQAVLVGNDQMALGVLQAARRLNRRVPEELGVVGFDDVSESAFFSPPLTTVRQNLTELGRAAVNVLSKLIAAGHQDDQPFLPESVWIKPQLVIRSSSVCDPR